MHPALSLLLWGLAVVAVQAPTGWPLAALATALLVLALLLAPARSGRLLRRSRFLLLAIAVLFAGFTPGKRLWLEPAWLPLTEEGVMLAAIHLARLLAVIALVAVLLQRLPRGDLVLAIAVLATPLRWIGGDPDRLAVRLALVLDLVADREATDWRHWLDAPTPEQVPACIELRQRGFGWRDGVALAAVMILVVLWQIGSA
ncbi:MAG: hypothetical protein KDH20_15555 [Rhodocyclaceae bacterium]|nr:hypothetical protein [Rhodocyclaceae bacterium]